jgi:hypothetical protein
MVPSAYAKLEVPRQIDKLFSPAFHHCANYEAPDTVDFISKAYVAQRYQLDMWVRIRIDRRTGRCIEMVEEPTIRLSEITQVSKDGRGTSYGGLHKQFGSDEWQKVFDAGGDFSVIGLELDLDNPVAGFEKLIARYQPGIQFSKDGKVQRNDRRSQLDVRW